MSGTLTLAAGEVFTGGTTLAAGTTGMAALTEVGTVTFNTSVSPPTIASIEITKDAPASSMSDMGVFIQSVTIDSVTPNSIVTLTTADLPPGIAIPPGFTLPQNVEGTALTVTVTTNDGVFSGTAGLYGTNGPEALVAVGSIDVFGFNVNAGAAILSLGTQATGSGLTSFFTPAFTAPCFAAGTRIRTRTGDVAVEALRIGDPVLRRDGTAAAIRFLGHRRVDCAHHPRPAEVWPVRVSAGAFAAGQPMSELWLSPDHAVFVDGVLIPIRHLINGTTIAQRPVARVDYWHVELPQHGILLAEGLPCESYLDTGNRAVFANGAGAISLHPDFSPQSWDDACAELVQDGPRLLAVKEALFRRAGIAEARPRLALDVQAGQRAIQPEIVAPGLWRYQVPPGARSLRLASPGWVPAHFLAASLDRRTLGVRLLAIEVDGQAIDLASPILSGGFHPVEATAEGTCRWTDGDARLVLPPGASVVTLRLADDGVSAGCAVQAA